jgi:hypothetical protein
VTSNIGQNFPYSRESEAQRADAVAAALAGFSGLAERVAAESIPLGEAAPADHGAPPTWWTWVCPKGDASGRLHVAGYARDRHALYTVCDTCGAAYLR